MRLQWISNSGDMYWTTCSLEEAYQLLKLKVERGICKRVDIMQGRKTLVYWEQG